MTPMPDPAKLPPLIAALMNPALHAANDVKLIETHISWVILAGDFAYKIKKPVDLGFLNFSTLRQRHHFCQEELRLNRRLAPQLYIGITEITGSNEHPSFDGHGSPIEYAVKMHRFRQSALLPRLIAQDRLTPQHVDNLAHAVASFHQHIPHASPNDRFGTPQAVLAPALENFEQIRACLGSATSLTKLDTLQSWTQQEFQARQQDLALRKAGGFVRECHGDMHSGNMVQVKHGIVIFDCLEFNPNLRWIDVISEAAFVVMDFMGHNRTALAWRFLNAYLSLSGDYDGLSVLRFYLVYRAMVRAKVAAIRAGQSKLTKDWQEYEKYIELALRLSRQQQPRLMISHGLSGSGKTTLTQQLLEQTGAIRLRSDVERKRLFGMSALQRSHSEAGSGLYTAKAGEETYARLAVLSKSIIQAGFVVIVDATFLQRKQRRIFHRLATDLQAHFIILDFRADDATLRKRLQQRESSEHDASEATIEVLELQLASQEPLNEAELEYAVVIDSAHGMPDWAALLPE